ncbi:MAG: hypothetical protein GX601_20020, partial [Anaerolineales bacterium]|nr:hypothetical protein [Anaerolineales bacterium]
MQKLLVYLDFDAMRPSLAGDKLPYDALTLISAVQGLVNRDAPELFVAFDPETDDFWLEQLRAPGKLLAERPVERIDTLLTFLNRYRTFIEEQGLVLWDEHVPASYNVAMTVCGVEGYLPVRGDPDGLLNLLTAPVKLDLRGKFTGKGTIEGTGRASSGSAKCDAYLWAMEHYLDRTSKMHMGYAPDGASWSTDGTWRYPDLGNASVPNRDFLIANRAFVFDLSPWADEPPSDDPTQPLGTDYATMTELFRRHYHLRGGVIAEVHGFVPWHIKYTVYDKKGKHKEVPSEWMFVEILSAYNLVMDADAYQFCGLANASVYQHYPLKPSYDNPPPPAVPYDPNKNYVMIYYGDYDAASWLVRFVPKWWTDPARGTVPISWAFNPNLAGRVPMVFDYIFEHKTANDHFIAGDSGAGYLNPTLLDAPRRHSDLPSGTEAWVAHNQAHMSRFGMRHVGFVINGDVRTTPETLAAYARFTPDGSVFNTMPLDEDGHELDHMLVNGMPAKRMDWDVGHFTMSNEEIVASILERLEKEPGA